MFCFRCIFYVNLGMVCTDQFMLSMQLGEVSARPVPGEFWIVSFCVCPEVFLFSLIDYRIIIILLC